MRWPAQIAAGLALAVILGCPAPQAAAPASAASAPDFVFAALGDTPYTPDEESRFIEMIGEMNREPLAFVVHVGDFKNGISACGNEIFAQRKEWFELSRHPFVYIPGDNEWADCWRAFGVDHKPLERLNRLREVFFRGDASLGQRTLKLVRQSDAGTSASRSYPEHARWIHDQVLFATLNVPGGDNNRQRMPEEYSQRSRAVHDWIRQAFQLAREQRLPALVLMMQANPWTAAGQPRRGYAELLGVIAAETPRFGGEVLLIHGDTHRFRVDHPLRHQETQQQIENFTRIEVFGSPFANWVRVSVRKDNGKLQFDVTPGS